MLASAAVIGLGAALVAIGVWASGSPAITGLEWSVYDRWLRRAAPVSSELVVVARDAASEARFGSGTWDRAVLSRLITSLSRAGAAVVGVDVQIGRPSTPGRGGASSDALLSQATALAQSVVFPIALEITDAARRDDTAPPVVTTHRSWPALSRELGAIAEARPLAAPLPGLAEYAAAVGHALVAPDPDGIVRRAPLLVRVGDRGVPALGVALAATFRKTGLDRIPLDRQGRALIGFATAGLRVVPLAEVWTAIEERRAEALQAIADDRIVLLLVEPAARLERTPLGPMSETMIQAHLLNAALTRSWLRETPIAWTVLGAALLAALTAWLWLALRWWKASIAVAALALAYVASLALSASLAGLLLPLAAPLVALLVASAAALVWNHFASSRRIGRLEGEIAAIRQALVTQESSVETLEEDLDAARAAAARSTGAEEALRAQLATARAQEEQTRARLERLERESRTLGDGRVAPLDDVELERLRSECERMGIVTRDPAVLAVFRDLEKAARSTLPILIAGEPGTGKELFARAAHRLSPRADGPFVAVNMAAISPELFESELFGHVRGSFTGAIADRKGFFEQASQGTIFLDEVGELRSEHQSKLLRVLQDKSFYRVGATRPTTVNVRVVAASNRDLEAGIAEGSFREDLYFRLKGLVLRLPPLRERRRDVPLLAARFAREAAAELGRPQRELTEAALAVLERGEWRGNVRELQNCLRQAIALADGATITVDDLRLPSGEPTRDDPGGDTAVLASLRRHGFDMQATARALGWDRSTVTQRLKGLGFRALVDAGGDRIKAAMALAGDAALGRTVELKLREYHEHLLRVIERFESADDAIAACRRRFKNLPERHFRSLELLVRQHFNRRAPARV
jgi:DNA-binding NtrC family response regulator/CHASE2 domain-containing sensor protein